MIVYYDQALKTLRDSIEALKTGKTATQPDSFVTKRVSPASVDTPQNNILAQSASWLKNIQASADKIRKSYDVNKPDAGFAGGLVSGLSETPKPKTDAQANKDAFVARRTDRSPSLYAPQRPFERQVPIDADMSKVLDALAGVESSGNYSALGPVVKSGSYKGQRAYGRYQIMEGNIAPWTKAVLGTAMTKEEFLADTSAQDAVAAARLKAAKDKHGSWEDAVSVWFSGRPITSAGNATDGYVTVPDYVNKFQQNYVRS
jgi:hypothetical protein